MYLNSINNLKIHRILTAIIIVLLSSCEKDLTIEIKTNDKRLIVTGEFTTDSVVHTANLYLASSLITGEPQTVVSGAEIFITDQTDTIYYVENDTEPGLYQTPGKYRGIGGQVYYLYISNVDIDNDGNRETYTVSSLLPMPIQIDSLSSSHGLDGDNNPAIVNYAYSKVLEPAPDYVYNFMQINQEEIGTIEDRLGYGELSNNEEDYRINKSNVQSNSPRYFSLDEDKVESGDTLTFIGYNFTKEQYDFLVAFDNNTEGDIFQDNFLDQLSVPVNMPTNIAPADKAAGFFMIYSISRISRKFNE